MRRALASIASQIRNSQLARFALVYAATASLQKGLGFVVFLWVAHRLDVDEYAVFGLLYATQTALTSFASAGIVESAIGLLRLYAQRSDRGRLFAAANSSFVVLGVSSTVLLLGIYVLFLRDSGAPPAAMFAVVIAGLVAAYVAITASLVRLDERHGASVALGFFVPVSALAGGAVGLWIMNTVTGFYAGSAIGSVVSLLPFFSSRVGHHRLSSHRAEVEAILRLLVPFVVIAMLSWLTGYGNTYLVEWMFLPAQVAAFTFAYTISSIMQLVATSLNQVWSPRFYRLLNELDAGEVERQSRRFTILQGLALALVGGGVLLVFTPAMDFAGGNLASYRDLRLELFFLCLGYAISIPWWHAQNYFYAHNKGRELLRVSIAGTSAGLVLWIGAVLALGGIGVYVGFFLQMLCRAVFALAWAWREWRIRIAWEGPLLAATGMLAGLACSTLLFAA